MNQCQQQQAVQQVVQEFDLQHLTTNDEAMRTEEPEVYRHDPIPEEDFKCDHIDPSIYMKKGVILQICNTNASAHATVIGGIRLPLEDIRKVPAYLQRYRNNIKKIAVRILNRHFQESQCSVGLHETLTLDDYGMTFTITTITDKACQFNPQGRKEAPLFYCVLPNMLEPTIISRNPDGSYQTGHIINLYVHLLPAHHRRVVLAKRPPAAVSDAETADGPSNKKPRPTYDNNRDPRQQDRPYNNQAYDDRRPNFDPRRLLSKVAELDQKLTKATLATAFPPLPTTKTPSWNTNDSEDLPDN